MPASPPLPPPLWQPPVFAVFYRSDHCVLLRVAYLCSFLLYAFFFFQGNFTFVVCKEQPRLFFSLFPIPCASPIWVTTRFSGFGGFFEPFFSRLRGLSVSPRWISFRPFSLALPERTPTFSFFHPPVRQAADFGLMTFTMPLSLFSPISLFFFFQESSRRTLGHGPDLFSPLLSSTRSSRPVRHRWFPAPALFLDHFSKNASSAVPSKAHEFLF